MHFSSLARSAIGLLAIAPTNAAALSPGMSFPSSFQRNSTANLVSAAQSLFDFSMSVNDPRWDETYKMLWYNDNGPWSTRFTAWYTAGLLHRNQGDDVENAKAALRNM